VRISGSGSSGSSGSSGMDDGGCKGHGAKKGSGSSDKKRAKTKATVSQGQAKVDKCTRRQSREIKLGSKCGEDQGVEALACMGREFGRKSTNEVVEARKETGVQEEEGVLSGHCRVEEGI